MQVFNLPKLILEVSILALVSLLPFTYLSNAKAETVPTNCDKYIKQAKETIFQTEEAVTVSKTQLQEAEAKAEKFQMLAKEGAISRHQLDKVLQEVQTAKKELDSATAKDREAKQQLATLQKLTSCVVLQ